MAGNIRGITVEISGDTTKLGKALKDVNSESIGLQKELQQVEKALKFSPGNTELIAQKQQVLAQNVEATTKKLETLKSVQSQVDAQFAKGDISAESYRAFQRELSNTESSLNSLKKKLSDVGGKTSGIDKIKNSLKDVGKAAAKAGKEIGTALGAAGGAGAAAVGGLVTGMQDFNQDLARLKTNASMAGNDLGLVEDAFMQITAVTGEADSAVETVSNLLATGFKDNQLAGMIDQINGAAIKFSDTLKTEGIADGIQETFATGEAVGQFGELLERSGVDLEGFNAKLQEAQKQGKGTEFVMQTMADLGFGAVTEKYKEMNPEVQANAEAQANLQMALANLAVALTPVVTKVTEVVTAFVNWANENPKLAETVAVIGGVIATIVGVFAALAPIVSVIMNLWPALAAVFGLITAPVAAIIAGIVALIAIGVLLYKNWDEVKAYASVAWEAIKSAISKAWEAIKSVTSTTWEAIKSFLSSTWNSFKSLASSTWEGIKSAISTAWNAVKSTTSSIWDGIKSALSTLWNGIKSLASSVWDGIKSYFNTVLNAYKTLFTTIWEGIKTVVTKVWDGLKSTANTVFNSIKSTLTTILNSIKSTFDSVWNAIKSTVTSVVNGIKSTITSVWNSIKSTISSAMSSIQSNITSIWNAIKSTVTTVVNGIKTIVTNIFNSFKSTVSTAMSGVKSAVQTGWNTVKSFLDGIDLTSVGKDIIRGLIKGISSMTSSAIEAVTGVVDGVIGKAKSLLQIKSPSRVFMEIGEFTNEGFIKGIQSTSKQLTNTMNDVYGSLGSSTEKMMSANSGSFSTNNYNNSRSYQPSITIVNQATNSSPSEIARKALQTQRQLAMEWGVN